MNNRLVARIWLATGLVSLILVWLALRFAPPWASLAGFVFLFSPVVITLLTMYTTFRHDRATALSLGTLAVLFLFAWFF